MHFISVIEKWCDKDSIVVQMMDDLACFGPGLFWKKPISDLGTNSDLNPEWRSVFSLAPHLFVPIWTPFVLGTISVFMHIGSLRWNAISSNWLTVCVWYVVCALFGCFGYAGQFGIIGGLYVCLVAFCCLVMYFVSPDENPCLDLQECYYKGHE